MHTRVHLIFFIFFLDIELAVSRMDFFEEWRKYPKLSRNEDLFRFIATKYDLSGATEHSLRDMKMKISHLSSKINQKWMTAGKSTERFLNTHSEWLQGADVMFNISVIPCSPSVSTDYSSKAGRPAKVFDESSLRTKRRRVHDLIQGRSTNELVYAAEVSMRMSGNRKAAHAIKDVSESSNCTELNKSSETSSTRCLSGDEALAYYVDSKSNTNAYKKTRKWSIKAGAKVFPSLYTLRKSKIACFPPEEQIAVTETRAEIKVQAVLDKTTERLILAQEEVVSSLLPCSSFTLISKWGCDGSSGHSTYKQKFTNTDDSDEYLFVFSFVPIQLRDDVGNIVWQNPRPSSTNFCRPIKFIFSKETKDVTIAETNAVLEEINALVPTICKVKGQEIAVKHEMLLTMVDGKVCNALTDTSSAQKCFICGATPKLMNDESREYTVNADNLVFGLSTLHAWIRCFECLLHISYRLDIKKWQARSESDKASVKQRSEDIKKRFKTEMGLIVDKPKPGSGNTNDGNTARRFFECFDLSAEITGLDVSIIKQFNTLLRALSSGYEIDTEKLSSFTQEIRKTYLNLYPWYYMPATVHKLLVHSSDVIKSALVPIGQLSEEAQEARNKDCRRFREHNTRKRSRNATNRDLLNMLLITSDPVINSLREVPRKKIGKLSSEVLDLLIAPSINVNNVSLMTNDTNSTVTDINCHDYSTADSSEDSDDNDN